MFVLIGNNIWLTGLIRPKRRDDGDVIYGC